MQKFTRPLTREVELAGGRLAFTFSEQGIAVRNVGSRKPPWEASWGALLLYITGHGGGPTETPSNEQIAAAIESMRKGDAPKPATPHEPAPAPQPMPGAE